MLCGCGWGVGERRGGGTGQSDQRSVNIVAYSA